MNGNSEISSYLNDVLRDWQASRGEFPDNTIQGALWPFPFFGNPAKAIVATVGVNPSSSEFATARRWREVRTVADWKQRLRDYFNRATPPHEWFEPWRAGLKLLGVSYRHGTAAHFDVSYRPTRAMLRNLRTDPKEFRRMADRDVAWFFRLLPVCERLRLLLIFGPIVRADGSTESLAAFVRRSAPHHGFSVLPDGGLRVATPGKTERSFFLHEVRASGRGTITEQVVANLRLHGTALRGRIETGI